MLLASLLLLTGCFPEAGSTNDDDDRFNVIPTLTAAPGAEPTPTPAEEPPPPLPEFVNELIDPGPTVDSPRRVFFRNGRDLWSITAEEATAALPQGTRFGAYATSPHGERAAIVILSDVDGEQAEAVHIYANGTIGPPVTPQRVITGPNAQTSIQALVWSRDATRIAIVYDEPALSILEIARPDGGPPQIISDIDLGDNYRRIQEADWAITSTALALLVEDHSGAGSLWMTSIEGETFEVREAQLHGTRSVLDIAWLPGRGRVAFVEERLGDSPLSGGSLFSIAPDGSGRELLVSNGNFAPAAEIIQIAASPGGSYIAFTVNVPDANGEAIFDSAWIVNIDSLDTVRVPVAPGFRVTDLWWMTDGLLWRAVHGAPIDGTAISVYAGVEPFVLGVFNPETETSEIRFQSAAD